MTKAGSTLGAISARTTRHKDYAVRLKKRKLVEEIFGWSKTIGGLRKARFVSLAKVRAQTFFTFVAYKWTRMATIRSAVGMAHRRDGRDMAASPAARRQLPWSEATPPGQHYPGTSVASFSKCALSWLCSP